MSTPAPATVPAEPGAPWDRLGWQPSGKPLGWWGMSLFIVTEGMIFALLLFSYFYLRADADSWPIGDVREPELFVSGLRSALLVSSSVTAHLALRAAKRGRNAGLVGWMVLTFLMATVFFAGHVEEAHTMWTEGERPDLNAYTTAFWTVVNFHAFHLLVGMGMIAVVVARGLAGRYSAEKHLGAELTTTYWHFVDVVWVFVYSSLYLSVAWGA